MLLKFSGGYFSEFHAPSSNSKGKRPQKTKKRRFLRKGGGCCEAGMFPLRVETFPNPERSQNRRFPEKSRIELRTGKFRPTQSHNLLLAKLILSPPYKELHKAGLRISFASNKLWLWVGLNLPVRNSIRDFSGNRRF